MNLLPPGISRIAQAAGRLGWTSVQILEDRLELLSLELREAKIRFVQALVLACLGVACFMFGIGLMVLGCLFALPDEWKLLGFAAAAMISLLGAGAAFMTLIRRTSSKPMAFSQSLAELKKDRSCFSTRN